MIDIGVGDFSADILINADNNFETSLISLGKVLITNTDLFNRIISAEFNFFVTEPSTGKVYKITEGRFDLQFTR